MRYDGVGIYEVYAESEIFVQDYPIPIATLDKQKRKKDKLMYEE